MSKQIVVPLLWGTFSRSKMPWCRSACIIILSFAPVISTFSGTARSMLVASAFSRTYSALWSTDASPGSHLSACWNLVLPSRILSMAAAFFINSLFWIPIHPQSSHTVRYFVSPSIRHFKLLVITSSSVVCVRWSAIIRATHLAACVVRTAGGSLAEKLCTSSAGNHLPAPAWAFSFPSASQTPFTYSCVITHSSLGGRPECQASVGPFLAQ